MNDKPPGQVTWKKLLPMCFGIADFEFGSHPEDDKRADEILRTTMREGASFDAILTEARTFLQKKGATAAHIEEQLELIRQHKF